MRLRSKLILGLVVFIFGMILVSSAASAQPPFQTSEGTNILEIKVPLAESIMVNRSISFHTHVYNKSTGLLVTNATTDCLMHIYNNTGHHILEENLSFDSNNIDFQLNIGGGNFSTAGFYSFIIECNASDRGGFVSGLVEATDTGRIQDFNNFSFLIAAIVFGVVGIGLFVSILLTKKMYLKVILAMALSLVVTTIMRFCAWFIEITNPLETNLIDTLNHFYGWSIWGMRLSIIFGVFYTLIVIINAVVHWKKGGFEKDDWEDWGREKL